MSVKDKDVVEKVIEIDDMTIKVIKRNTPTAKLIAQGIISELDAEMDARAAEAVRVAVSKAIFCKKPVAKYDLETKRAYIEYPNGERKYVD